LLTYSSRGPTQIYYSEISTQLLTETIVTNKVLILDRFYSLNAIELSVFLMQLIDTCKEGDGLRNNINKKRLLLYFKSSGSFNNYAIEMFTSIAQIEAITSEEMAHRLTWGRFVNWHGGQGKNIACDMAQEICNRVSKDVVRGMGPNKTVKAMTRASKAAAGIQQIVKRLNSESDIKRVSQVHSHKSSTEDELLMVKDLQEIKPFMRMPGRHHAHFDQMQVSPSSGVDMKSFFKWLEKHKKQIAMGKK
jgi:hypothetical protein